MKKDQEEYDSEDDFSNGDDRDDGDAGGDGDDGDDGYDYNDDLGDSDSDSDLGDEKGDKEIKRKRGRSFTDENEDEGETDKIIKRKRTQSLNNSNSNSNSNNNSNNNNNNNDSKININQSEEYAYSRPSLSHIKDKNKRRELNREVKKIKVIEKKKRKLQKKKEKKLLGDDAPPPQPQRTLENTREPDDTFVKPDDEELKADTATDEFSEYFMNKSPPKILITTSPKVSSRGKETLPFINALVNNFPNSVYKERRNYKLKEIVQFCIKENYTDIIVINEDRRQPNALLLCHLPDGPTALFKLTSVILPKNIHNHAQTSDYYPEIILNNFSTRLGHSIGRMLAALVPQVPEFKGRRVMTFHNQRDFVFFRQHRYIFESNEKARLQEIGPRFTLKLQYLQHGTFDSKFGEYEWIPKKELITSRRRFFL